MGCKLLLWTLCVAPVLFSTAQAQEPTATEPPHLQPSWETQKRSAAYTMAIPAPRGQITDRNGVPLAQTRIAYNLSIVFPTPLNFTDAQIIDFANRDAAVAKALLNRPVNVSPDLVVQHYRNRGLIPFDIVTDLPEDQANALRKQLPSEMVLRAVYLRFYPQGSVAGHIVGYIGRTSRASTKVLQNNDPLLARKRRPRRLGAEFR